MHFGSTRLKVRYSLTRRRRRSAACESRSIRATDPAQDAQQVLRIAVAEVAEEILATVVTNPCVVQQEPKGFSGEFDPNLQRQRHRGFVLGDRDDGAVREGSDHAVERPSSVVRIHRWFSLLSVAALRSRRAISIA